ncbi:MAG TPA: hypothetical protein VLQ93_17990 [Myxococcaceae bacterium]|nr:hypothetical protein [Myxococcaceae bacterium]
MIRPLAVLLVLALGGACAHTQKTSHLQALRPAVESFHQRIRWRDYRYAARYIVPERRQDFEQARRELHDERDLSITDYEIEGVELSEDNQRAIITSRISWMRLPSVSEQSATVTSEFVHRDGVWLLERQLGGPFDGELP